MAAVITFENHVGSWLRTLMAEPHPGESVTNGLGWGLGIYERSHHPRKFCSMWSPDHPQRNIGLEIQTAMAIFLLSPDLNSLPVSLFSQGDAVR